MSRRTMTSEPPPLSLYETQWRQGVGAWQPGLPFALGFEWDAAHQVPQPIVQLMGQALTEYAVLSVDANCCLVVAVDLTSVSPVVCVTTPAPYLKCVANLTADGQRFSGAISSVCAGPVAYD